MIFFFLEGSAVSDVVHKFKCLLKKRSLSAHAVGFLTRTGKGLIVIIQLSAVFNFKGKFLYI